MATSGIDLLMSFLTYDPAERITAEEALRHPYFRSVVMVVVSISLIDHTK